MWVILSEARKPSKNELGRGHDGEIFGNSLLSIPNINSNNNCTGTVVVSNESMLCDEVSELASKSSFIHQLYRTYNE